MESTNKDPETQLALVLLNGGREGLKNLLAYQVCTKVIPYFIKSFCGAIKSLASKRVERHVKQLTNMSCKAKSASIILSRDYEKDSASNILFDAVLSYVSELPQTKYVKRTTTGVFMMATDDEIEISSHIFVKKLSEKMTDDKIVKIFVDVYSYTYDLTTLRKYLDDLEDKYKMALSNQLGKNIFYFDEIPVNLPMGFDKKPDLTKAPTRLTFSKYVLHTNKSLKNIYGDSVKVVRKRVDFFINNKRWYEEKGVPYTLGLLLHGVPGAGKTSCIKSIAKDTNRHILNIRLSPSTTVTQLNNLFYSPQVSVINQGETKVFDIPIDKRILVLEDVDCLSDVVLDRKHVKEETEEKAVEKKDGSGHPLGLSSQMPMGLHTNEALNLSTLLNILDGVLEQPGRIIIMTSNHPEKLDKALIRPGRIDVIVHFNYCKKHEIAEIVQAFTNHKMSDAELQRVIEDHFTPAEVTQIIFENFDDIQAAIQNLSVRKQSLGHEEELLNNNNTTVFTNVVYDGTFSEKDIITYSESSDKPSPNTLDKTPLEEDTVVVENTKHADSNAIECVTDSTEIEERNMMYQKHVEHRGGWKNTYDASLLVAYNSNCISNPSLHDTLELSSDRSFPSLTSGGDDSLDAFFP